MVKARLYAFCQSYVQERIERYSGAINEAQSGANDQTKSSAGDKHETGRAMAQLETENNAKHLSEAKKLKAVLSQINPEAELEEVQLGAVVFTNNGNFYLAISAGRTEITNKSFFLVSATSPIGQAMLGKKEGDSFKVNSRSFTIQEIE